MNPFIERHQDKIAGVISCFDRVVITGTLPDIGYAGAMASYLRYHNADLPSPKKIMRVPYPQTINGAAIRLYAPSELLIVAEGIETALGAALPKRHSATEKQ